MKLINNIELIEKCNKTNIDIYAMEYAYIYNNDWKQRNVCSDYTRIYLIKKGTGIITHNDTTLQMQPGNIYIIPSGYNFSYDCTEYLEKLYFHIKINRNDNFDLFYGMDRFIVKENCPDLVDKFISMFNMNTIEGIIGIKYLLSGLIYDICSNYPSDLIYNSTLSNLTEKAIEYIDKNLNAALTVDIIANALFVSQSKLQKCFKADIDSYIGKYISDRLMLIAEQSVRTSELSIKEISDHLGFYDQFYFSRKFKMHFGISPLNYRKQNKILHLT